MTEENVSTETTDTPLEDVTAAVTDEAATTTPEEVAPEADPTATPVSEPSEDSTESTSTPEDATQEEATAESGEATAETETPEVDENEALAAQIAADPAKAAKAIKDLRKESADRRGELAAYEAAFEGTAPEFKTAWLELAALATTDPEAVREALAGIVAPAEEDGETVPLTAEQIEERVTSVFHREQETLAVDTQRAILNIEINKLGYNTEADPEKQATDFASYSLLRGFIAAQPEGQKSLEAAHASVQKVQQELLDAKLAELTAANTGQPAGQGGGVAPVITEEAPAKPKTAFELMKEAEEKSIRDYEAKNAR